MSEGSTNNKEDESSIELDSVVEDVKSSLPSPPRNNGTGASLDNRKGEGNISDSKGIDNDPVGEVNVEAYITLDDVIRAGGFGARDDISSFLPVASDSTDFEATILDASSYEEPQGDLSIRPGLGWRDATERK